MDPTAIIFRPTERSFSLDHRRASAPVFAFAKKNHDLNSNNQPCCSDGDTRGCGCSCRTCCCRFNPAQTKANQHNYNDERGKAIPTPFLDATKNTFKSSSVNTNDSCFTAHEYISNSWEAQPPFGARIMADDFGQSRPAYSATTAIKDVNVVFTSDDDDDDDPNQWPEFYSRMDGQLSIRNTDDDLENMTGNSMAMEMGDSLTNSAASILSTYELGFQSQYLICTGTSFSGNNFLPLTPDCRHERTRQMCAHCMHY